MEKLTYTTQEAADLIGISKPKVLELCHSDGFPSIWIGRKAAGTMETGVAGVYEVKALF